MLFSNLMENRQKVATKIFEHFKFLKSDGTLDMTAALETTKELVKDADWLNVTQEAFQMCNRYSEHGATAHQSNVKFTKDECNMKYQILISCIDVFGFSVSLQFVQ